MNHIRNRPSHRSWPMVVFAVVATVAASACGSTTTGTSATTSIAATVNTTGATSSTPASDAATTTTTAAVAGSTLMLTEVDKGTTIKAHVGDKITLTLSNTYWIVDESSGAGVLHQDNPPRVAPKLAGCVPGAGCGTVTTTFTATTIGTTTIKASRTTCGEALRCTADNGTYQVTVEID